MKKYASIFMCAFLALFLLPQISCTIIGFATGAAIGRSQPKKEKTIQGQEIVQLKKNTLITVHRKKMEPITGSYRGTINVKSSSDSTFAAILLDKKGAQSERYYIPTEQIDHIYVPARKSTGEFVGTAIGAAIDITLLILFLSTPF